jgi:hypothetical protein
MGRSEDTMSGAIDSGAFFLGLSPPQHENDGGRSSIDRRYHGVSKTFPTLALMRSSGAVFN